MVQTVNTPIHTTADGQIIENLDLYVTSGDAITVTNDNVIIRNCRIHHQDGDGISLSGASNVTIENCEIINSSPPTGNGPETSEDIRNIFASASPNLTVDHVTLRDGSSGMYLVGSPGATISNVEGFNFHGPFPRGQFVQFNNSGNSSLTNFYVYNDPAHSHVEDNVSVYYSPNVKISNGVIDGNNSPSGVGVMFEGNSGGGKVDHVDAIHMGNGAFSSYSPNVTFDYTRSFDNIATDQGRGLPLSNALIWNISNTGISIEHSTYTHPGNPNNIAWDTSKAVIVDVHQDTNAISMGDSVTNDFAWDNPIPPPPPPPPVNHLPLITSNNGGATASMSVAENTTAVTKVVATDSDTGQTLAYSIVPVASGGGADASKFVIDATTGALAFKTAPNFEAPTDAFAPANVYDVTVQVSDNNGGIDRQAIAVTVTDQPETPPPPPPPPPPPVNHLPLITSDNGGATASMSVAENTTAVTKVVATDSDTGQTLAYSIVPVASGGGADASKFVIDATTGALAFKTAPNFEAPTDALAPANVYDVTVQVSDNNGGIDTQAIAVTVTDQSETPPPPTPPDDLVLRGGPGNDHLDGGDGNDQLYGSNGNDILVGHAGNDVITGERGGDILMGGPGNDAINGNWGKDYLLLDGTMQDYTLAVNERGVTITNSAGEVDTVKNVEVFHFSDGTNYLVGRNGLVQTGDQTINKFLADSGVDQSYFSSVPTAGTQQQPVQAAASNAAATNAVVPQQASITPSASADNAGTDTTPTSLGMSPHHGPFGGFAGSDQLTTIVGQALNQAGHTQGAEKLLGNTALWNAVDAASNNQAHAGSALADLKQQLHDAFDHGGATGSVDELAALLPWTHHE